jgi:hypothetical protein
MSKSDRSVIVIMLLLVLLYLAVWATGYFIHQLAFFTADINIIAGIAIIGYWVIRQMQIQQHTIEIREIVVLSFELLVIIAAFYGIASGMKYKWIVMMQYIVFGLHLLVLLLGLIFMFTFKMKKLI